jgi:hypothetical protein
MRSLAQTKSWRVDKGGFTPSKNELRDYDIHGCADISAHERSNTLLKLTDEHSSVDPNFTDAFTCVYQASETNRGPETAGGPNRANGPRSGAARPA